MLQLICCVVLFLSTAVGQSIFVGNGLCRQKAAWDRSATWSPDCQRYFVNGRQSVGPSGEVLLFSLARSTRVFTIRGKRTSVEDPTQEVRRDLAVKRALACPFINVEAVKWLGPRRLLLRADLLCGEANNAHNLLYAVDVDGGKIRRSPAQLTQNPE